MKWKQKFECSGTGVTSWDEMAEAINDRTVFVEESYERSDGECEELYRQITRLRGHCVFLLVNLANVSIGFLVLLYFVLRIGQP